MCRAVFAGSRPPDWIQWAKDTFISSRSQDFGFSTIHEVILKLRYISLEEEISKISDSPGAVDIQDTWGYTALHWASARGDFEAMSALLRSGADPNLPERTGKTALHLSVQQGKFDCAMQLLHHGVNAQSCDITGFTALHIGCAYNHLSLPRALVIEFLNTLICMGVDINSQIITGETGLFLSLQDPQNGGNIPLKVLLDHGADHRIKTFSGRTILHAAGEFGNVESLQILRDAHLSDIDIHARMDDSGETAMDMMLYPYREFPASEELIESFKLLLAEIEARTSGRTSPRGSVNEKLEDPVLPNPSSAPEVPSVSTTPTEFVAEESDSEDEVIFKDSVEYQVSPTA